MFAREDGKPIARLPAGLARANDAVLALNGIYHIHEVYDFDPYTEIPDGIGATKMDLSGPIPVIRATMKKRALTEKEITERFEKAKADKLASIAEMPEKNGTRDAKTAEIEAATDLREIEAVTIEWEFAEANVKA